MPRYEYKCDSCGDLFEVKQGVNDDPLSVHPACGGRVERLISVPALQFKGTGWYVTDYARKSGSNGSAKQDKPAGTETKAKPEPSAASKPSAEK